MVSVVNRERVEWKGVHRDCDVRRGCVGLPLGRAGVLTMPPRAAPGPRLQFSPHGWCQGARWLGSRRETGVRERGHMSRGRRAWPLLVPRCSAGVSHQCSWSRCPTRTFPDVLSQRCFSSGAFSLQRGPACLQNKTQVNKRKK